MHDREVDLDLIEPTCMDGPVHEHQIRILPLESFHGARTAVRRTVVDDPEYAPRVAIGRKRHGLARPGGRTGQSRWWARSLYLIDRVCLEGIVGAEDEFEQFER